MRYKETTESEQLDNAGVVMQPEDKDYVSIQQLNKTMRVVELRHSLRVAIQMAPRFDSGWSSYQN
jgi:cellulose biosynthesis protein BcsQ